MEGFKVVSWLIFLFLCNWVVEGSDSLLSPKGVNYEVAALMSMKRELNDELHVMDGWDINSVDPCTWTMDEAALLQGEQEAEKMIVEAYSALLLAFLSTESKSICEAIADNLPDHNLSILVPALDRFVKFHLSLNMISPETHKAVSEVIESCRIR